ncbi:MAG: formyl transferase [Rickettsiales bacterium]
MSNWALNLLAPLLKAHTLDLMLSERIGKAGAVTAAELAAWQRVESDILRTIETQAAGPFQSFSQFAAQTESGAIRRFPSINQGDGLAYLRAFTPDLILSIRFGQIFKPPAIGIPRLGIVNLHSGILPEYRGVLATFWALLQGEKEIGCTLHYVTDDTIDTGAIIDMHRLPVNTRHSLAWHIMQLYAGSVPMIASALRQFATGEFIATLPQKREKGSYFTYPAQADVDRFLQNKHLYKDSDYLVLLARYGL